MLTLTEILSELSTQKSLSELQPRVVVDADVPRIPTLEKNVYVPASPLVAERFGFAESWNGPAALRFLSRDEMAHVWRDGDELQRLVRIREEHWEGALMASLPRARVSLIAASEFDGDEVYLLWGDDGREPRVVSYSGHSEDEWENLRKFMLSFI
jgi:hypothetical protein